MTRPFRLDHAGARHHVMNRGARRAPIFLTDEDCVEFVSLLAQLPSLYGVEVHAYALMENHFHLLLRTPRANLSAAMAWLQSRFARSQNLRHRWDGPIFRGRFHNRVVEDDRYWRNLLIYLHLNPVRAHLVGDAELARWTSHRAYLGLDPRPAWLSTGELLALFGGVEAMAQDVQRAQRGGDAEFSAFDAKPLWRRERTLFLPDPPSAPRLRSWEEALGEAASVAGVTVDELLRAPPGRVGNPARWLAIWWLQVGAGLGGSEIARRLGVTPALVSKALRRVRVEPELREWRTRLEQGAG